MVRMTNRVLKFLKFVQGFISVRKVEASRENKRFYVFNFFREISEILRNL